VALIRKETMKKIIIVLLSLVLYIFGIFGISPVSATTCPFGGSPNWKGECDTTTENNEEYFGPPMTEEEARIYTENNSKPKTSDSNNSNSESSSNENNLTSTDSSFNTSNNENISQNSTIETITQNPDLGHGYAAIDTNGNVLNIIVCAHNVCGKDSNWLNLAISQGVFPPGTKLVLQTLRNQETGNVAGYIDAWYDNEKNIFTVNRPICAGTMDNQVCNTKAIFEIPVAYPGSQELKCIQNCDVPVVGEQEQENTNSSSTIQENNTEENLTPMIFSTKFKPNSFATVVATNKNKIKIWKTKVNKKGKVKININKKYKKWNFKVKVGS
jgi:hypothetical protein